jgi:hypothetical protein
VQGTSGQTWRRGHVTLLFVAGRVWLAQPFYEKGKTSRLRGVALCDAAWQSGPIGIGATPQDAFADWKRLAPRWESATPLDSDWSLPVRLRQFLEPQSAQREAQIRALVEEAARLHDAMANPKNAALLREKQSAVLKKLQELTGLAEEKREER